MVGNRVEALRQSPLPPALLQAMMLPKPGVSGIRTGSRYRLHILYSSGVTLLSVLVALLLAFLPIAVLLGSWRV